MEGEEYGLASPGSDRQRRIFQHYSVAFPLSSARIADRELPSQDECVLMIPSALKRLDVSILLEPTPPARPQVPIRAQQTACPVVDHEHRVAVVRVARTLGCPSMSYSA